MKPTAYVNDIFNSHITSPQLTTTENTITYHNILCWSLQHFAEELSLVSLWSLKAPRETENNAYAKFWSDQQRVLWYLMIFSVVVNLLYTDTHTH